jgi:hypothetical protein
MLTNDNSWQCDNSTIGGQTQTALLNSVTATEFGPHIPTTREIAKQTARTVANRLVELALVYNEDGNVDWNATFGNTIGADLRDCAKLSGGVCGLSLGGSQGAGGGIRYSLDVFVDQNGHIDVLGTLGGGGYLPPLALLTGNPALATHVETSKFAVTVIHNATINDMRGWSGQFGGGAALGQGITTEWVFGANSQGSYWHGLSVGGAEGAFFDVHLTATYSWSGREVVERTIQMVEQLQVAD